MKKNNTKWHTDLTALIHASKYKAFEKYLHNFSEGYISTHTPEQTFEDIVKIEQLEEKPGENYINMDFLLTKNNDLHVQLFHLNEPVPLSDSLPILENLGLRTITEVPYQIKLDSKNWVWIHDFHVMVRHQDIEFDFKKVKSNIEEAFIAIISGNTENDGLNQLILNAGITVREVLILRAYTKYLLQTGFRFSQHFIEEILNKYASITQKLIALFQARFRLHQRGHSKKDQKELLVLLMTEIEGVSNLDDDYVLRAYLELIQATLRTNFFQKKSNGQCKDYLSYKLDSAKVPGLSIDRPMFEIFVYAFRFEGIHLRAEKVARGGLRYSDRLEDYRTEVLGLMKAQVVKNSLIVPSGAKGGFVVKKMPQNASKEAALQEVIACYQLFVKGLLDLTDNIKDGENKKPVNCICYDPPDPYLVVAADKGTASFSDIANAISGEYNFWLGDAFASGGSAGYDHKKIAITARGAWESIKRQFYELDIVVERDAFTVAGVGDMSGDVFGNGMLYTNNIRLLAAFDHRHIFVDPTPDAKRSYEERMRLFNLPRSSWDDYDKSLISAGGGVFSRASKSIAITPQMKQVLDIEADKLTPNALIHAILQSPVDLFYNGGIGTYVKASTESHADVSDKANDYCRVNASELRCKIFGEGGNLGVTKLARIEYALEGGRICGDFIDNAGGVNCSDNEVNIKILLNKEVANGSLTIKNRNKFLAKMQDDVAQIVLRDNYEQVLILSMSATNTLRYSALYREYLKSLEQWANFDRDIECLPDDKKLLERNSAGIGLTRPELALLLAYTKIYLTKELVQSTLLDDPFFLEVLESNFPALLVKHYRASIHEHPLKREIIATQLANQVVNMTGLTFVYRLQLETGSSCVDVVRAFVVTSNIYDMTELFHMIESLDGKISLENQYELYHHLRWLINLSTRWFLRGKRLDGSLDTLIAKYHGGKQRRRQADSSEISRMNSIKKMISSYIVGDTRNYFESIKEQFVTYGLKPKIAREIALSRVMYTALNIIEITAEYKFDLQKTAEVYLSVGGVFHLVWFRDKVASDHQEGYWNALARMSLRDELDNLQRHLTVRILQNCTVPVSARKAIAQWIEKNPSIVARFEQQVSIILENPNHDYAAFFIVLKALKNMLDLET